MQCLMPDTRLTSSLVSLTEELGARVVSIARYETSSEDSHALRTALCALACTLSVTLAISYSSGLCSRPQGKHMLAQGLNCCKSNKPIPDSTGQIVTTISEKPHLCIPCSTTMQAEFLITTALTICVNSGRDVLYNLLFVDPTSIWCNREPISFSHMR